MAVTLQTILDNARETLQDDAKVRYPDEELIKYANDGLNEIFTIRPDLFLGQLSSWVSDGTLTVSSNFPIATLYTRLLADYVIARAETQDSEFVDSGRVNAFSAYFRERLLS